jgi:GAF domain-containing protein
LNRRLTGEGWRRYLAGRSAAAVGYEAGQEGLRAIPAAQALPEGEAENQPSAVSLPLLVRGEPIGSLDVTSRTGEPPNAEVQEMLTAVAERVALALDSTRLGDSTLRQVEREQMLGRLTAELQSTTDLDALLQIAAREASRSLGTPRGFVHLVQEIGDERTPREDEAE